jgi:electron transport complex protein RnfD
MLCVILALLPACIYGVFNFGFHALLILCVSTASAVIAEALYDLLFGKKGTVKDLSAVVTGLLIGMNMPPQIDLWIPCLGSVFAIVVIKQLYGGLGQNFMNPALGARCFLLISFAGKMTTFTPGSGVLKLVTNVPATTDALSGATPLAYFKTGALFDLKALFLGTTLGCIGEVSAIAILAGGIFLLAMKVIRIRIPGSYLGTFAVLTLLTASVRGYDQPFLFTLQELCAGGLMLGAWFMATDYVTSPITAMGQIVFGCALGFLTWVFRMIGSGTEGVSYSIIFMNLLVPVIERYTRPVAAGMARESRENRRLVKENRKEARRLKAAGKKEDA